MSITFHIVPQAYFDTQDPNADYTPRDFAREGFIHCTDGAAEMALTANRYYRADPAPYYYLAIETARVIAPIKYEDARQIYPHIFGALNRDAIVSIQIARRNAEGAFLPPEEI